MSLHNGRWEYYGKTQERFSVADAAKNWIVHVPTLQNPRHERLAQELAAGKTADAAYVLAGYRARSNAARLSANRDNGPHKQTDNNIHQVAGEGHPQPEGFSVCCDALDPFFLSHRPIGNNVNGVGVCSLDRLRCLPIATIKQCACSRNSRGSWRFWIAHYSRKRFDGRSRIITGGILNVGQDFRPSVRISTLARFEACASRSSWHLPDIAC
jgi:hypothetical protein